MRILYHDEKDGALGLRVDTLDDLWYIYNIIGAGDKVYARTLRRESKNAHDKLRSDRGEKRPVYLGIDVKDVEWHKFADILRIRGIIIEGPDKGSWHTINVTPGVELKVVKEQWNECDRVLLAEAVKRTERPTLIFVSMDDEEATIAYLHDYGVREVARVANPNTGKMMGERDMKEYFGQVMSKVKSMSGISNAQIVLIGPGFAKEEFYTYIKEKGEGVGRDVKVFSTSHAGMNGIYEAMKGGIGEKVLGDLRIKKEVGLVERLLECIRESGKKCAYGLGEVQRAAEFGAVDILLVIDKIVRKSEVNEVIKLVRKGRGTVYIVSSHHEGGRKLEALGGIAALLKYSIE
ncbi:MAG: mRNA surveillance protein pelota [Thermoplasmata archaeon]|nr:MAG: mRNA surveillance protein pelota [Thermoplasmata archaeon]